MMTDRSEQSVPEQQLNKHGAMKMNPNNDQLPLTLPVLRYAFGTSSNFVATNPQWQNCADMGKQTSNSPCFNSGGITYVFDMFSLRTIYRFAFLTALVSSWIAQADATTLTLSTQKRGYASSTGWRWVVADMMVGLEDNPVVNNVIGRGYAWFDIPSDYQRATPTAATLSVQVKDLTQWNAKLTSVKLYDLGTLAWASFYQLDGASAYNTLGGGTAQGSQNKAATLSFTVPTSRVQSKAEIGFSFRAYPEDPSGTIYDDSNYIYLNNPVLILQYLDAPSISASDNQWIEDITVNWNLVSGAVNYELWKNTANDFSSASKIMDAPYTDHYQDQPLTPMRTYYYWVRGKDSSGRLGLLSSPAAGRAKFNSVSGISASDGAYSDRVMVTWDALNYATEYQVRRSSSLSGSQSPISSWQSSRTFNDTSAAEGITYYYWVYPRNQYGEGSESGDDTGYRPAPCTTLSSPSSSSPSCGGNVSTTTPTLRWTDVANESGYVVRVFGGDICSGSPIHTSSELAANTTSYQVPASAGLQNGQTYSWEVQAKGNGSSYCDSGWSSCCSFLVRICTTLSTPNPSSPSCGGSVSTTTPTLSWTDLANESGYAVQVFAGGSCSGSPIHTSPQLGASTTSYQVPASASLQNGQTYSWEVQAKGNGTTYCDSGWSSCCPFTILPGLYTNGTAVLAVGDAAGNLALISLADGAVLNSTNLDATEIARLDVVDVDNDQRPDLLATHLGSTATPTYCFDLPSLALKWRTDRTTAFEYYGCENAGGPRIWVGDFAGDGVLKLLIPYQSGGRASNLVFNAADGRFQFAVPETWDGLPVAYFDAVDSHWKLAVESSPNGFTHDLYNYDLTSRAFAWTNTSVNTWQLGAVGTSILDGNPRIWGGWYGRTLYVADRDGHTKWQKSFGGGLEADATYAGDLRGDGSEAVLVTGTYGTDQVQVDAANLLDGSTMWSFVDTNAYWSTHSIAIADADNGGPKEVIIYTRGNENSGRSPKYQALRGSDGTRLWQQSYAYSTWMLTHARLADVNNDGRKELLLAVDNTVEARDVLSGALLKTYTFTTNVTAFEVIRAEPFKLAASFTGNGLTIRFPTMNGKKYRLESTEDLRTGTWSGVVQDNIVGDGELAHVADRDAASHPQRFYRVVRHANP
jgi:hypothetical protein